MTVSIALTAAVTCTVLTVATVAIAVALRHLASDLLDHHHHDDEEGTVHRSTWT